MADGFCAGDHGPAFYAGGPQAVQQRKMTQQLDSWQPPSKLLAPSHHFLFAILPHNVAFLYRLLASYSTSLLEVFNFDPSLFFAHHGSDVTQLSGAKGEK